MSNPLKKEIETRMKLHKLSIRDLERKAGLGINAVRNIISGLSKNPNSKTLKSIAEALECEVDDLLPSSASPSHTDIRNSTLIYDSNLFSRSVELFLEIASKYNYTPSLKQAFLLIGDIYLFALEKRSSQPDKHFIEFLIKRHL